MSYRLNYIHKSNVRWDSLDMVTYPVVDGADAAQVRLGRLGQILGQVMDGEIGRLRRLQ